MRRSTIVLLILVLVFAGLAAWSYVGRGLDLIRVAFAEDQTQIFAMMLQKADESLSNSPAEIRGAVAYLGYVRDYYPSGTKQIAGSRLDKMVERDRIFTEAKIVDMLRKKAEIDYGTDPEAWIQAYPRKN
jgi:hypothetical protein